MDAKTIQIIAAARVNIGENRNTRKKGRKALRGVLGYPSGTDVSREYAIAEEIARKRAYRKQLAAIPSLERVCESRRFERLHHREFAERNARWEAERNARINEANRQQTCRRRIFHHLRKLGFVRECVSGKSAYYVHRNISSASGREWKVRVSNHDVPWSDARERASFDRCHTWMDSEWSINYAGASLMDIGRWLVSVRQVVRAKNEVAG